MIPPKTSVAVRREGGTALTSLRSATPISPLRSVTPIPMITTITRPRGGKAVKLSTASVNIRRTPSAEKRLTTFTSSPVAGWTAERPRAEAIPEVTTTESASSAKSVIGSGRRFPLLSIRSRMRRRGPRSTTSSSASRTFVVGDIRYLQGKRDLTARCKPLIPPRLGTGKIQSYLYRYTGARKVCPDLLLDNGNDHP